VIVIGKLNLLIPTHRTRTFTWRLWLDHRPLNPVLLPIVLALFFMGNAAAASAARLPAVRIGNFLRGAPCGIAWVVDDNAAFVLDTGGPYVAGTAAPDNSYHAYRFTHENANILFEWGRVGDNIVGRFSSDKRADLDLGFSSGWPGWTSTFTMTQDGADGLAPSAAGPVQWTLRISPAPTSTSVSNVTISIAPGAPVRFVAGLNKLPGFKSVDGILNKARDHYNATRPKASGDLGDFVGAIEDNLNNSRLYANDNHRLAYSVSRGWSDHPNGSPYFCWDSFFTANLGAINDPVVARNTVRAMLSYQSSEGLVPNFAHWNGGASMDRSQPPVASLCVWKMHERYPHDQKFLAEIYPMLVKWHDWWMRYRNNQHDGLLEWGSSTEDFQAAQYETGWDDNLHYAGAAMRETTMDAYSIDLSSLWAMDAHYLALIADFLGHKDIAARFRREQTAMNRRINARLWNSDINCYCSRFWNNAGPPVPLAQSAFGPGFEGVYYRDEKLQTPASSHHAATLNFNWDGQSPLAGVPATHWSARWKGTLTPPKTGVYQFVASADDGVRVFVNGRLVMEDWSVHPARIKTADVRLSRNQAVPIVMEYFQADGGSQLDFSVQRIAPPSRRGGFLTRLTPMNFYPLAADTPDDERARQVLQRLTNPKKFWGRYLLPTLAYDDPDYYQQEYWRGDVWGPPNYIVWQGIKKYASPAQITEFADRNVELFMTNWLAKGVCGENYLSTNGEQQHDPHYTWGALLCLIGLESIVDVDDSGRIVLNGAQTKTITLKNIPLLGRTYDVKTASGSATLIRDGKVILTANDKIVRAKIR
jgi:Mannosylglycerate hydrolase MGH1-like glycoside hydrolase domain/PA14 domain